MYNILICDDERDIVNALKIYLTAPDITIYEAFSGKQALETAQSTELQLVLMDIMMPELDGISALARLRERSNVPVILLTAKSEDTDKILGLNVGADDYITKPFSPMEVVARVRSQLRRYTQLGSAAVRESSLSIGPIELSPEQKRVLVDGEEISFTPIEFDILRLLMETPGRVFGSREIYQAVWGEDPLGADNTVAVHVRHIREKIEINPAEPRFLKVVWGRGYKIEGEKKA